MPFDGNGTYAPPSAPNFPAIPGAVITASYYNAVINDIAAGLSLCLTRDGQGDPTNAINWNNQNLTGVAAFGAVSGAFSAGVTIAGTLAVTGALTRAGNTVWDEGNDGPGSGLNADLLDGLQATAFQTALGYTPVNRAGDAMTGGLTITTGAANRISFTTPSLPQFIGYDGVTDALQLASNTYITFQAGGYTEFMRLTSTGNLGIGVTPVFRLHVKNFSDGTQAVVGGVSKGIRVQTSATASTIEGVDQTGAASFQPLFIGGSEVSISGSGSEHARFSATNLRVLGDVYTGSVSAGNILATQLFVTTSYAPLASPALTGVPTAPTAAALTNTTQLATTAFATTANALKANLASPALTGTPTADGLEIGYRDIPRVTGGIERGKMFATAAGFTLNTGAAAGSAYSVYNDSGASITITQGGGLTLRLGGTATTGNRTLAARSIATIWFNSTTEAIISGAGVT